MIRVTKRNLVALGIAGVMAGMASTAMAQTITFDPNAVDAPGGGGALPNPFDFDEITITALGTAPITITDANNTGVLDTGDTFTEMGVIAAVNFQLNNGNVFGTGVGNIYELLADFDLVGTNTLLPNGDVEVSITGGTGDVFFDQDLNNAIGGNASQIGALTGATGDCSITAASGLSQGSCVVNFDFASTDDLVWTQGGVDLQTLMDVSFRIDINVDQLDPAIAVNYPGGAGSSQIVQSDFDGSARIDVPEPATLSLLAFGLIGLGRRMAKDSRRS